MSSPPVPSHLARAFNFGALAALCWLPFELSRVGWEGDVAWVSLFLFWGLGVAIGSVVEVEGYTVRRLGLAPFAAAHVYALGSFLVMVPVARNLFAGSFAATLPGASSAPYWVPLGSYLALTWALWLCLRVLEGASEGQRRALRFVGGLGLVTLAFVVEGGNRHLRSSEYPDLHTFGVVVVFIATYLAACQFAALRDPNAPRSRLIVLGEWLPFVLGPAMLSALVSSAVFGLQDAEDRLRLAQRGQHSRWLVRSVRGGIDLDADGFARVFGGPDCNDLDASISPDASEVEGNEVDENCDGFTSRPRSAAASQSQARPVHLQPDRLESAREATERWHARPELRARLAELADAPVILISVDALRDDVLHDTLRNREQFPEFFALLDDSVRFEHAFAPAAGTDLSMSTLMTGHVRAFDPTPATLAEHLRDAGWYTSSVVPSEVLRYAGTALLKRGFLRTTRLVNDGQERDVGLYSSSARATRLALDNVDRYRASMQEREEAMPLALWVHYFDAHEHDELSPYDRQLRAHTTSRDPVERYRASVALVDAGIGELRRGLEARGLWSKAIVVLVSDHGESLGEDERLPDNHGRVLYSALTDVPLAIRVPGVAGAKAQMPATLVDVAPTLLKLLGIEARTQLDGEDLTPELFAPEFGAPEERDALQARPLPMYESEQRGLVAWPYKLLWRPEYRVYELFDLSKDPLERADLSSSHEVLRTELAWTLSRQPQVVLDRTPSGRRARELAARVQD